MMRVRGFRQAIGFACLLLVAAACSKSGASQRDRISATSTSRILFADPVMKAPSALQAVRITVISSATAGPTPGYYTYVYQVTNDHNSTGNVAEFGVAPVAPPDSMFAPEQWITSYGYQENPDAAVWSVADTITVDSTVDAPIYSSPYEIQINETKIFTLVSRRPPTSSVSYYAQAFDSLPDVDSYTASGPGGYDYPSLFRVGVTGTAIGPDINSTTGVEDMDHLGDSRLKAPKPNPSAGSSAISFYLPTPATVRLGIYDVQGKKIRSLVEGALPAGLHSVTWNGTTSKGTLGATGVYFYRLEVNGKPSGERKVTLVR
jgi:hypothetical protein